MKFAICAALLAVLACGAWLSRYSIVASGSGGTGEAPGTVRAWELDRWTGKVRTIGPQPTEWE